METQLSKKWRIILLLISCVFLAVGSSGGPLIMRLYFIKGGKRIWFSSWMQTAGCPIILIPLTACYFSRRKIDGPNTKLILMKYHVFIASAIIGTLTGFDDYLYSYGVARLPVSTSSLIIASQLVFTAFFAFLLVKQRFSAYSINAIVLLTVGAGVLALNVSGDKPEGESNQEYVLGFVMTVAAAVLAGLLMPAVELTYLKAKQSVTYTLVLEIQVVLCFFATAVCTVGMLVNKDFQAIPQEAREFEIGESKYYLVIVWSVIIFQIYFLGAVGVIFCASALLSGVTVALCLPFTEILAVVFYSEKFQAQKGISLALSIWGFVSYFYGELKQSKKAKKLEAMKQQDQLQETELATSVLP